MNCLTKIWFHNKYFMQSCQSSRFPQNRPDDLSLMGGGKSTKRHSNLSSLTSTDRIVQNFLLVWLDANIDKKKKDYYQTILHLRRIVNTIHLYTNCESCLSFLHEVENEKIFFIVSGHLGKTILPLIHALPQLNSIYIFCQNPEQYQSWTLSWSKIKGFYTEILPLCESLKNAAQQCDQNAMPVSFISPSEETNAENLNQLDPSFMYTQILKEILLGMTFEKNYLRSFVRYCRELYHDNEHELMNIQKFQREYKRHSPIWWYTYDCCIYSMLNRALRNQEVDTIIRMGFFIRDLHEHLESLHKKQFRKKTPIESFLVYRGQSLASTDFDRLIRMKKGGLMSFNSFLSTTKNKEVSLDFTDHAVRTNPNSIGILFQILIDPSISTTPFAKIDQISFYKHEEEEILFSMHTIFRIGSMEKIDENLFSYWQVNLVLTDDHDPQLKILTERIRKETDEATGWPRLGNLLIRLGNFPLAEQIYNVLLRVSNDPMDKARFYHQIGVIKNHQQQFADAVKFYQDALEIYEKHCSRYHPCLATCYKSLALAYHHEKNLGEALNFYHHALIIEEYILPSTHLSLALTYHDLAFLFNDMKEYSKALLFYQKTLEIYQKNLPQNHPHFAACYNNIGSVYQQINQRSQAVFYYQNAVKIGQSSLANNHPDLKVYKTNLQAILSTTSE